MDTSKLTSLVNALRAETAHAAITPESLGALLQKIVDALALSADAEDVKSVKSSIMDMITDVKIDHFSSYIYQRNQWVPGRISKNNLFFHVFFKDFTSSSTLLDIPIPEPVSTGAQAIACSLKDDCLYVQGASKLVKAGLQPYIFRYTYKRNRVFNEHMGEYERGRKQRGWHLFYAENLASVADKDLIKFTIMDNKKLPSADYLPDFHRLVQVRVYVDDSDHIQHLYVGFGKKTFDAINGRRFKFGIAFAPKQTKQAFDFSTLATNIAPFYIHVRTNETRTRYVVDASL